MVSDDTASARERLAFIGEIAAEIAHEIRNALQIVSASAYVARVELNKGDAQAAQPHVAKIEKNARAAHGIVDDLLSLARGEAIGKEVVLVAAILAASRADWAPGAADWVDEVEPSGLRVRAHAPLLTRLIRALYENAIQASAPRQPLIRTRAHCENGRVVVEIADDGPGVSEAIAGRVFEPLVTGRAGGTGLGLALAQRIAVAHGGSISLLASDGAGACFRIALPADNDG